MAERGGSIVNVTTGGRRAERSAAHAALVRLTESLSTELAPRIDVRLADVAELVTRREPGAGRRARPDPPAAGEVA
jgi:NAD(P)-dependent dehydrogenase (short-subunit alcohol dehydrogenase family)